MSFAQELKDFTDGFTKSLKLNIEAQDSAAKRKYYEAYSEYLKKGDKDEIPPGYVSSSEAGVRKRSGATSDATVDFADPAFKGLKPYETAFVNAIAMPESGGRWNVRYSPRGPIEFTEGGNHPNIREAGPAGPSTAAGLGQFTNETWNEFGGGAMTRPAQVQAILKLGRQEYNARTGRDFDKDLQTRGFTPDMAKALSQRWVALGADPTAATEHYRRALLKLQQAGTQPPAIPDATRAWSEMYGRPVQNMNRGGIVQKFANGGLVRGIPEERWGDIPQPGSAGMGEYSPGEYSPKRFLDLDKVAEAVDAGVMQLSKHYEVDKFGAIQSNDPDQQTRMKRFASTEGAPTAKDVAEVDKVVDPNNELTPDQKSLARLNAGYQYWKDKGDQRKAGNYAASLVAHAKQMVHMRGAEALQRLRAGDVAGGAAAIQSGYDQIPDGKSIRVVGASPQGVKYQMYDENGDMTEEAQASVDQLLQLATGMANGSEFFRHMGYIKSGMTARERGLQRRHDERQALRERQEEEGLRKTAVKEAATEKAQLDEQELAGMIDNVQIARTAYQQARQGEDLAAEQQAQRAVEEAEGAIMRWGGSDPGRLNTMRKFGLVPTKSGRVLSTSGAGIGGAPTGGAPGAIPEQGYPRGATAEDKAAIGAQQQYAAQDLALRRQTAGQGGIPGPLTSESVAEKRAALRGDYEFKRNAGDDLEDFSAVDARFDKDWKGMPEGNRYAYRTVANSLAKGNRLQADQAAFLTSEAINKGVRRLPDGRVQIADQPPMLLDEQSRTLLAKLRGENISKRGTAAADYVTPAEKRAMAASAAETADTDKTKYGVPRAEKIALKDARERERLRAELGADYDESATIPQLQRALKLKRQEEAYLNPKPRKSAIPF